MHYSPGQDGLTNVCVKPLMEPQNIIIILESSMALDWFGFVCLFFVPFFGQLAHGNKKGFARRFLTMLKLRG